MTTQGTDDSTRDDAHAFETTFLSRLAHELRGPAGVIHGALDELTHALGDDAARHAPLLAMARRGVRRIVRDANRLQHSAQLRDQRTRLRTDPRNVADLVKDAADEAQNLENRRQVELVVTLPPTPVVAEVDSRWLLIALHELAAHAIRRAHRRVEIRLTCDAAYLTATYHDDGADDAGEATAAEFGLGLSLGLVRGVVQAHGGELIVSLDAAPANVDGPVVRERFALRMPLAGDGIGTAQEAP